MSPSNDQPIPDLQFSLNQLGEETTAAELLRSKGQTKKLKVISEKKLMDWILALLQQNLAGKADAFSDEEKQELLAKAQAEIAKRMKVEKELDNERDRRASELRQAQEKLANSQKSTTDYEAAIAAYKAQLEQRDKTIEDLQQDNFDLQDELNQKIALLRTTIEEKDRDKERLQHSLRNQMVRSTGLLEGVIGLDNDYYGARHQNDNPVPETAAQEEQFYHDFDVGAAIVTTLGNDLGRLRGIATGPGEDKREGLLETDLALLAQLKSGSLAAVDVAQPVAGLVEAGEGARTEAIALERANLAAIGGRGGSTLSALPDDEGKPAEVIAGVTHVLREITTLLARERTRLGALKSMADEADAARNAGETELDSMRAAYDQLVQGLTDKATSAAVPVPSELTDATVTPTRRIAAAQAVLDQLADKAGKHDPEVRALETRVATQVRDLGKAITSQQQARGESSQALGLRLSDLDKALATTTHDPDASPAVLLEATHGAIDALQVELARRDEQLNKAKAEAERLREERSTLAAELETSQAAVKAADSTNQQIATQLRDLGRAAFADASTASGATGSFTLGSSKVNELDNALTKQVDAAQMATAAKQVIEALRKDAGRTQEKLKASKSDTEKAQSDNAVLRDRIDALTREVSEASARAEQLTRSERDLSATLIEASKGDAALADTAADLSLTLDDQLATASDISAHSKAVVEQLVRRKYALEEELNRLKSSSEEHKTKVFTKTKGLEEQLAKLTAASADTAKQLATVQAALDAERARAAEQSAEATETAATAKEVIQQLKQQQDARASELAQLKHSEAAQRADAAALRGRLATAESANRSFADALTGLARATAKDSSLASHTKSLEQALANLPGEESVALDPVAAKEVAAAGAALISGLEKRGIASSQEVETLRARVSESEQQVAIARKAAEAAKVELAETKKNLAEQTADAVETAATAKEAIQTLRAQMSHRDDQIKELRAKEEAARTGLEQARARLSRTDASNRTLAETLSQLAQAELATAPDLGHLEGVEEARLDLELALSELPAEGEQGVQVSDDLAQRLADTGQKAAAAVAERRRRVADSLTKAKADADRLTTETAKLTDELQQNRTTTFERDSSLKRTQAELTTLRAELREQAASLAGKIQDLSDARSKLSAAQADLDSAAQKSQAQEQTLASTQADLARAKSELAKLTEAQARAESADQAQSQLVQAFAAFSQWDNRDVAAIVTAQGSPLARANSRISALDAKDRKQAAAAQSQFLDSVHEQLSSLAAELAAKRSLVAGQTADIAHLQEDLSSAKTALIAREQEIEAAKANAEQAARRVAQAEVAARELASAITLAAGDDAGALAKAVADTSAPVGIEATKAGVSAMHAVAERLRTSREAQQRVSSDLAHAAEERDQAQRDLAAAIKRASAAEHDAREAHAAERQVSSVAADLSRELLGATKAMAADTDTKTSKQASEALARFETMSATERVNAAAGLMPALREVFTALSIDAAETKAKVANDRELHDKTAAALRRDLDNALTATGPLHDELAKTKDEKAALLGDIAAARAKADRLEAKIKEADAHLLQANAELDDYRARGVESSAGAAGEAAQLSEQLAKHRKAQQQAETDLTTVREKLAAYEARLARQRDEMNQRLAERDQLIADKTREFDELAAQQSDSMALQAKIDTMAKELSQAHEQLARYKAVHGDFTGATAQAGDLKKSLKGTEAEREGLRAKLRDLESELADKKGEIEEAQTALDAKTKEMVALRERKDKEIEAERSSVLILREAERKLKEENVGLKARVRRLTEQA